MVHPPSPRFLSQLQPRLMDRPRPSRHVERRMPNTAQMTSVSRWCLVFFTSHFLHTSQNSLSRLAAAFSLRSADYRRCLPSATRPSKTSKRNVTTSSVLSKGSKLPYANKKRMQVSFTLPSLTGFEAEYLGLRGSINCRAQTSLSTAANRSLHMVRTTGAPRTSQPFVADHKGLWLCHPIHLTNAGHCRNEYIEQILTYELCRQIQR